MITFTTASGSRYEVLGGEDGGIMRRVEAGSHETARVTSAWKSYKGRTNIIEGHAVVFVWHKGESLLTGSPEGAIPTTITSPVVTVMSGARDLNV